MSNAVITEPEQESFALKVDGKRYTCPGRVGARRCGGKTFRIQAGTGLGQLIEMPTLFFCAFCSHCPDLRALKVEVLLPMRNDWRTPGGSATAPIENGLWTTLHREYKFNLDVAADKINHKCGAYFDGLTPKTDGLLCDWHGEGVIELASSSGGLFCPPASEMSAWGNPPYNPLGSVAAWLTKALEQAGHGVRSVLLVPMATSVAWFNDLVVPYAEWHSFRGRIAFEDPAAAADAARMSPKQDNLLVIYDPHSTTIGHAAVRDAKTGRRLWTRPDLAPRTSP